MLLQQCAENSFFISRTVLNFSFFLFRLKALMRTSSLPQLARQFVALGFIVLGLMTSVAQALEFRAIGANPVILYDAPSAKGGKLYVAPRGMPVEVILTYGAWTKVRDASGDLSWVESKELVARRNIIVKVSNAKIRAQADDAAALVFSADKNVP
jgi:hypothetical protein